MGVLAKPSFHHLRKTRLVQLFQLKRLVIFCILLTSPLEHLALGGCRFGLDLIAMMDKAQSTEYLYYTGAAGTL